MITASLTPPTAETSASGALAGSIHTRLSAAPSLRSSAISVDTSATLAIPARPFFSSALIFFLWTKSVGVPFCGTMAKPQDHRESSARRGRAY